MDRREQLRFQILERLEQIIKGCLRAIFFGIILVMMLFGHSLSSLVLACALLLGFIMLSGRME